MYIQGAMRGPDVAACLAGWCRYNDLKLEADRKAMELREALDVMNAIKVRKRRMRGGGRRVLG